MDKIRNMKIAGILKESIDLDTKIEVPSEIELIKNAFSRTGFKLYVVGGAVRDVLLKKTPEDYDLSTNATYEEIEEILNKFAIKNFPKGKQFGVISAMVNGEEFEIASFRKEEYDGTGRRPSHVEHSDIEDDAMRRDLTINALYYDIDKEKIIDLVGGIHDLKNGIVRTVGSPEDRMFQDRLRVMRAIRFANVIGGKLDTATQRAIIKFQDMQGVSNERIRKEFYSGLLKSKSPSAFLNDLNKFGIFNRMFPKMNINTNFNSTLRNPMLVIGLLLINNNQKDVDKMMTEMKYTKDEKQTIEFFYRLNSFFKNFSVTDISLKAEAKRFIVLLDKKYTGLKILTPEEIMQWCKLTGVDENAVSTYLKFNKRASVEIPEIQNRIEVGELPKNGKEVGDATNEINLQDFLSSL